MMDQSAPENPAASARVVITYCTQCNWLLRAAWMAQEVLQTFPGDVAEVALRPATGGVFRIDAETGAGTVQLWNRKREGGFPDVGELKRRVRDAVAPGRSLGHLDRPS